MNIVKIIMVFILTFFLYNCGNVKSNRLADGIIDKSTYSYPPDPNEIISENSN